MLADDRGRRAGALVDLADLAMAAAIIGFVPGDLGRACRIRLVAVERVIRDDIDAVLGDGEAVLDLLARQRGRVRLAGAEPPPDARR